MNWGMRVLQTLALPLGYVTVWKKEQMLCKNPYISALCGFSCTIEYNTKNGIAESHGLIVGHDEKYGWTLTSPSDDLLDFILENELTDILITRNEFYGVAVVGTGAHSSTGTPVPPRTSSSRKYVCPCCGNSVRATKCVHIACMDCREEMVLAG